MPYTRPKNPHLLTRDQKLSLLKEYANACEARAETDPVTLSRKVPREAFAETLDTVGELLLEKAAKLAAEPGPVREFLDRYPVPGGFAEFLPDEFRVFCLSLNALKQWVSAEQAATDRYLLGGQARELCREAFDHCLVTGGHLGSDAELHHPIRDGRPPIPLSKKGHQLLEGQTPKRKPGPSADASSTT
jgi:hypothetical protein